MNDSHPIKAYCLLYTSYHSYFWDNLSIDEDHSSLLVLNFSGRPLKNYKGKVVERSQCNKFYFFAICILVAVYSKFRKYDLFIPHPDHLLGNVLFFGKKIRILNIIEDGILNYYNATGDQSIRKKQHKRRILTFLTPFRYYIYKGHISGIDETGADTVKGYFLDPDSVYCRERYDDLFKVVLQVKSGKIRSGLALFLDQPIELFLEPLLAKALRKRAVHFLESKFRDVLIKPHPQHIKSIILPLSVKNENFKAFDKSLPAEEIVDELCPEAVVSFCSTSLINISKIMPEVFCYSVGMSDIARSRHELIHVLEVFENNLIQDI